MLPPHWLEAGDYLPSSRVTPGCQSETVLFLFYEACHSHGSREVGGARTLPPSGQYNVCSSAVRVAALLTS